MLRHLLTTSIFLLLFFSSSAAQRMAVPVEIQVPLFSKILTFVRNLETRVGEEIVLGIVFQSRFRTSLNAKVRFEDVMSLAGIRTIKNLPVRLVSIDIYETELDKALEENLVDIVYLTPLRAVDVKEIGRVCSNRKVLSMTGVPEYCSSGAIIGIASKGGKPEIIINLRKAEENSIELRSQLLKIAKIIE